MIGELFDFSQLLGQFILVTIRKLPNCSITFMRNHAASGIEVAVKIIEGDILHTSRRLITDVQMYNAQDRPAAIEEISDDMIKELGGKK